MHGKAQCHAQHDGNQRRSCAPGVLAQLLPGEAGQQLKKCGAGVHGGSDEEAVASRMLLASALVAFAEGAELLTQLKPHQTSPVAGHPGSGADAKKQQQPKAGSANAKRQQP